MVGKEHVGQMVWAAWQQSREVFNLRLLDVTRTEGGIDPWYKEPYGPGPWTAQFGERQNGNFPGKVHNPTCLAENCFLTEAEARACIRKYCENVAEAGLSQYKGWTELAKQWS